MTAITFPNPRRALLSLVSPALLVVASVATAQVFDVPRTQRFNQNNFLLFGETAEPGDSFGYALAAGDFDCDGFDDLAVGVPFEDASVQFPPNPPTVFLDSGVVHVIYGTPGGLNAFSNQYIREVDLAGGATEALDRFGEVLAAADFDGDLCDDLAIGTPFEHVGSVADAGAVYVVFGSPSGLDEADVQVLHQGVPGVAGAVEADDEFGSTLATGDFDGDGIAELVIGAMAERLNQGAFEGAVWVFEGTLLGLIGTNPGWNQLFTQDDSLIDDVGEPGDAFGSALASCDFDGDGFDDLVIGVSGESATFPGSGALHVLFGSASGITKEDPLDVFLPGTTSNGHTGSVLAAAVTDDVLGCTIADGRPLDDLIVPAGTIVDAGSLGLVRRLLSGDWGRVGYRQGMLAVHYGFSGVDSSEPNDQFAAALAYGDFSGSGFGDLAIGTWAEDLPGGVDDGLLQVLPTLRGRQYPEAGGAQAFRQADLSKPPGVFESGNAFGRSLAAGDFDGNGFEDLAVGVPYDDLSDELPNAGALQVLYSAGLFRDGFEGGDVLAWSEALG